MYRRQGKLANIALYPEKGTIYGLLWTTNRNSWMTDRTVQGRN